MAFKAELLRKKLKEEGKTRKFLAEITRKTERTVSRWLTGENPPKGKDLDLIAKALKCRPQDFDPSYADEGLGVAIYARVSVASHNAYEMMRLRYGVTQKSIIELAPVLFSIMSSYALKVPDDDMALHNEAIRRGLDSPLPGQHDYRRSNGFAIDQRASENAACFGLPASDEMEEEPRNLFFEAIARLSLKISDQVSTEFFHAAEPGEAPSAAGFVPDLKLITALTGGDASLIKALVSGRIRLSKCLEDHLEAGNDTLDDFPDVLRHELAEERDRHHAQLETKRQESLSKLVAWRAFYEDRHPDLAREYDQIIGTYCHEDGWVPEYYGEELKEHFWSEPYNEHHFIDENRLPDVPKTPGAIITARFTSPIAKRFEQLKAHRSKLKAEFEELGK